MNPNLYPKKSLIKLLIAVLITIELFANRVNAQNKDYVEVQTYTIESFNGQPKKITAILDFDDRLKISYLKDTLYIYNTYGTEGKAEIINKKFLKITYGYKAGSDLNYERVVLVGIKDDKLCVPISVTSVISWEITQVYNKVADSLKLFNEVRNYQIKLKATLDDRLIVDIHDENTSKHDPKTNYNNDYNTVLLFDEKKNVFYNKDENLAAYYTIFHPDTYVEEKKYIWGNFPVIHLGKIDYYYINGQWYEKGENNYLIAYSTTNVKSSNN